MTLTTEHLQKEASPGLDLVDAVQRVLRNSIEPLTLSKIRVHLPSPYRGMALEELADTLNRQVAAKVLVQYPKYRSSQDRYWDRPLEVHIAALLETTLNEGPLAWSELRRKLPAYAQGQAEVVLQEQVTKGRLHRHPRTGRGGERFGTQPPDPREYLRSELATVFQRLESLGFSKVQLREGALELLHEEEWAFTSPPAAEQVPTEKPSPATESGAAASSSKRPQTTAPPAENRAENPAPHREGQHSGSPSPGGERAQSQPVPASTSPDRS